MNENINNLFSFYREVGTSPSVSLVEEALFSIVSEKNNGWPQMVFDIYLSKSPTDELEIALAKAMSQKFHGFAVCDAGFFNTEVQESLREKGIYPIKTWILMDMAPLKQTIRRGQNDFEFKELNTHSELSAFSALVNSGIMQSVKINPALMNELYNKSAFNFYGMFAADELVSGLLTFSDQKTTGLYFIVTKSGYRGKGLAGDLIRYVVELCYRKKTGKLVLQAVQKAVPLYTRFGFSPRGKLVIFWKR